MRHLLKILILLVINSSVNCLPWNSKTENKWNQDTKIIDSGTRSNSKIAVLIIAPANFPGCFIGQKWQLGKSTWEKYMNVHPHVDCYFIKPAANVSKDNQEVWIDGNTVYVYDEYFKNTTLDRILYKTIKTFQFLEDKYTHFVRTNLNTFWDLNKLYDYVSSHTGSYYTSPCWEGSCYPFGYAILCTKDVAKHIYQEYFRLEGTFFISNERSDDGVLFSLATGLDPWINVDPFNNCPTLPPMRKTIMSIDSMKNKIVNNFSLILNKINPLTIENYIHYIDLASPNCMVYRSRGDGLTINEIQVMYNYLLKKHYNFE